MSGKTFTVRRGSTAIPNQTIYAKYEVLTKDGSPQGLSIQALGLLLLILSRPSGKARQGYRAFEGRGMGRDALLKALRELDAVGHRYQFKRRSDAGHVVTDTVVSEVPISQEEAELEWRIQLGSQLVDNSPSDRAPENGATGPEEGPTVRRVTVARSTGASSVPEAKVSIETSSQETRETKKQNQGQPSPGGEIVDNDAAERERGPEQARLRAMLDEAKAARLKAQREAERQKDSSARSLYVDPSTSFYPSGEVASLRIDQERARLQDTPDSRGRWLA